MQQGLRGEDLADRRRERRRAHLVADPLQLLEDVVDPVGGSVGAKMRVERGHEAGREGVLGGADGDARRERSHRVVADVLVDEVGGAPQGGGVDGALEAEAAERLRQALAGDAVEAEGDRVDGAADQVGARSRGLERGGERVAGRALEVDADGQTARLGQARDELGRAVGLDRPGRVVEEDTRRAEVGQLARLLGERLGLARLAGAVDEAGVELAAGRLDRLGRLAQVGDVVQRVVEPEDLDPARRGGLDEVADELAVDRAGADEEPAAEGHAERRRRPRLDRADPLPRTLDAAPDGGVEDATARDLEQPEARLVEDPRQAEERRRRHPPRERLLPEQANRRVDELRHRPGP